MTPKKASDFYHVQSKSSNFHVINFQLPREEVRNDKSWAGGGGETDQMKFIFELKLNISLFPTTYLIFSRQV